jgi:hypothetical protein
MKPIKTVGIKDLKNNPLLLGWARDGIVTLPLQEKTPLEPSPVKLSSEIVNRLLEEDREERGL